MNDVALVEAEARKAFLRTEQHHWLTIDEAAHVLQVSPSTAKRDWRTAKAWLTRELGDGI